MVTYAILWAIGVALMVLGFVLSIGPLVFVGGLLGIAGFFTFVRRGQGTRADPR